MPVKFLLDENLPKALSRALRRRAKQIDALRAQEAGLMGAKDPEVLEYTAAEGRVLVSRDKRTLRTHAKRRIAEGKKMTGLLVVRPRFLDRQAGLSVIVEELALIAEATDPVDWISVERFIPYLYA